MAIGTYVIQLLCIIYKMAVGAIPGVLKVLCLAHEFWFRPALDAYLLLQRNLFATVTKINYPMGPRLSS